MGADSAVMCVKDGQNAGKCIDSVDWAKIRQEWDKSNMDVALACPASQIDGDQTRQPSNINILIAACTIRILGGGEQSVPTCKQANIENYTI